MRLIRVCGDWVRVAYECLEKWHKGSVAMRVLIHYSPPTSDIYSEKELKLFADAFNAPIMDGLDDQRMVILNPMVIEGSIEHNKFLELMTKTRKQLPVLQVRPEYDARDLSSAECLLFAPPPAEDEQDLAANVAEPAKTPSLLIYLKGRKVPDQFTIDKKAFGKKELAYVDETLLVSDNTRKAIEKAHLTGFEFIRTKDRKGRDSKFPVSWVVAVPCSIPKVAAAAEYVTIHEPYRLINRADFEKMPDIAVAQIEPRDDTTVEMYVRPAVYELFKKFKLRDIEWHPVKIR